MEVLLWLAPAGVVTVVAMLWVSWLGRERAEVDREVAVARMAEALGREHPGRRYAPTGHELESSPGLAVRPTRRSA